MCAVCWVAAVLSTRGQPLIARGGQVNQVLVFTRGRRRLAAAVRQVLTGGSLPGCLLCINWSCQQGGVVRNPRSIMRSVVFRDLCIHQGRCNTLHGLYASQPLVIS